MSLLLVIAIALIPFSGILERLIVRVLASHPVRYRLALYFVIVATLVVANCVARFITADLIIEAIVARFSTLI